MLIKKKHLESVFIRKILFALKITFAFLRIVDDFYLVPPVDRISNHDMIWGSFHWHFPRPPTWQIVHPVKHQWVNIWILQSDSTVLEKIVPARPWVMVFRVLQGVAAIRVFAVVAWRIFLGYEVYGIFVLCSVGLVVETRVGWRGFSGVWLLWLGEILSGSVRRALADILVDWTKRANVFGRRIMPWCYSEKITRMLVVGRRTAHPCAESALDTCRRCSLAWASVSR